MVEGGLDAHDGYCPDGVLRDAAGWVLGALDASDAQRFAGHLPACDACQAAVAELRPAARALLICDAIPFAGGIDTQKGLVPRPARHED
jgi:hypothetical protein